MDNYIVSARKYRPMTFSSVVGQEALTTTLKNAVKTGRLAHAYLFCGPRGVGKTTCARIFAKAINCENPTPDGEACNECESCKAFNEKRSMNIFELDAASNNSVENIKSLMDQTLIPPQTGKYKVFIIDEVHMLTTSAFNAFLKTLEEPPQYVIFILATTEKNKILPTILSRCQIYDFERMTVPEIIQHLEMVAGKEGITYEEEALNVIAEKADGGMRDALSIFDQVASFSQGNITFEKVLQDLNVLDADNYFKIVDLSLDNKVGDIMLLLDGIIARGFDGGNVVNGLASHIRNVMMAKDEQTLPLLEVSQSQRQKYQQQAQKCPLPFLYKALRILNECDVQYRQSSNKRLLVELTLIRVAQITQPEDADIPGAGRSPMRLKSLFKKNNVVQPKPAMQVTGAAKRIGRTTVSAQKNESSDTSKTLAAPQVTSVPPSPRPLSTGKVGTVHLNFRGVGMTFAELRRGPKQQDYVDAVKVDESQVAKEKVEKPEEKFTEEDIVREWTAMCNRMPQKYVGLAARLKNIVPVVTDYPNMEVVVDNQLLLDQISQIRRNIRATMRIGLHNSKIEFSVRLAEQDENARAMTKLEVFDELRKANPSIEKLRQVLGLELS
jgi:DNA polymerase-3 subunit gamma/tau